MTENPDMINSVVVITIKISIKNYCLCTVDMMLVTALITELG